MRTITLLLFFALSISVLKAEKYALLIGVGDYPEWGKWKDLASVNDIAHLKEVLKIHNFAERNMMTLINEEATKDNIVKAFDKLSSKLNLGDIVLIHFSGHGQQIPDLNEDEADGYDEAFVPYDSPQNYQAGKYEGKKLLIDDEINELTLRLRKKLGSTGQVIFIMDSCHSGSGNRALGTVRGTDVLMAPEGYTPKYIEAEVFEKMENNKPESLAPMGSFFGSSPSESNYQARDAQGNDIGSLSFAVTVQLAGLQKPITFKDFFQKINQRVRGMVSQNPQWDGPAATILFGKEHYKYIETNCPAKFQSSRLLKGLTGTIRGVNRGSKVEVFSKTRGMLGQGTVKEAELSESLIELDSSFSVMPEEELSIEVKTRVELPIKSTLVIQLLENSQWQPLVKTLKNTHFIQELSKNGELYLLEKTDGTIQLATREGNIIFEEKDETIEDVEYELLSLIKAYGQGKFLRSYQQENSIYNFSIALLPAEQPMDKNNLPPALGDKLQIGTEIYIAIKNEGNKAAYFSLIDIQPDNQLNIILPLDDVPDACYLQPGETYVTDFSIEVGEPIGKETLKLICTNLPLYLAEIIETRGRSNRSYQDLHSFERGLEHSYQRADRRGKTTNQSTIEELGITTLFFTIEE